MVFLFFSNRYTVEETIIKMNSQVQVDMLHCWKCRKCIANLDCLISDQATDLFEVSKDIFYRLLSMFIYFTGILEVKIALFVRFVSGRIVPF